MVRVNDPAAYKSVTRRSAQWRAPLGSTGMRKSRLAVHPRCACSGVKALRNTSPARRQAAKLCYRFGPLTPSARSANLIAGHGTKNGFPAPNKELTKAKNNDLTGKAPYGFESISVQRRVKARTPRIRRRRACERRIVRCGNVERGHG